MKAYFLFLMVFFGYTPSLQAQKQIPAIEKLIKTKGSVIIYQMTNKPLLEIHDLPESFKINGQQLIKNENGLFLLPFGTGRIYQLDTIKHAYKWNRIDSTYFTGYNFGCLFFSIGNKFYSFGGHGFWQINPHLRFYNPISNEWNIQNLNQSIPWARIKSIDISQFYHFDTTNKKLIIEKKDISYDMTANTENVSKSKNKILSLDLEKGDWTILGETKDSSYRIYGTLPWGIYADIYTVIDIQNNRILKFSEKFTQRFMGQINNSIGDHEIDLVYCIDSTIYFGNYTNKLDSITISRADLIDTGKSFYTKEKNNSSFDFLNQKYLLLVTLIFIAFYIVWQIRKRKISYKSVKENKATLVNNAEITSKSVDINFKSTSIKELLDENEKNLLTLIYENSKVQKLSSLNEINECLGVSNRSIDTQKRVRSIMIGSINKKLSSLKREKENIIDKVRTEFDKRSYEYFIQEVNMDIVENILTSNEKETLNNTSIDFIEN